MTQSAHLEKNNDVRSEISSHQSLNGMHSQPSRTIVHAKLEMTEPGDHDEQEADAIAETITAGGKISRKISGCSGTSGINVSNQMESQLNQLQGGGHSMPTGLRNMMESGFGQDFSHVRLHTDSEAASLSSSIHAKAFTHGNDIYFNQGQFSPNTTEGQKLMAHELTHVVQGGGKIGRDPLPFPLFENPFSFYGYFFENLYDSMFCNHNIDQFFGSFGTCKNIFGTDYTGPWNPVGFKKSAEDVQDTLSKVHDLAYRDRDANGALHALLNTDVIEADKFLATTNLANAFSWNSGASFSERLRSVATGLTFGGIYGLKQLGNLSARTFFDMEPAEKQDILKIIYDAYCNKELTDDDINHLKKLGFDISANCN